jgi:hypothetical protein
VFDDAEETEDAENAESKDDEKDEKSAASDPAQRADLAASTNQGKPMFDLDNENGEIHNFC